MEEVRVLVRFGGAWETSADEQYAYKGGTLRGMRVTKGIPYKDFVAEVYKTIEVDANEYDLKMEVLWRSSSMPIPPMEISNGSDLCFFLDGFVGSTNDFIPLCISLVSKVSMPPVSRSPVNQISNFHTHSVLGSGSNQIGSTIPSLNGPELEINISSIPEETLEEQLPVSQTQMSPPLTQQPIKNDAAHNSQGNPHHVDDTVTNSGEGNALGDEKGVSGRNKENKVKDDAPVDNVNRNVKGLHQNLLNARPSKPFYYLPYLPDCDNDKTSLANNDAPLVGQAFSSKKELQKRLSLHALKNNYQFKVYKSTTKRFEAICIHSNCKWRSRAVKIPDTDNFELKRFDPYHTCTTDEASVGHRQGTSWLIVDYVKERLLEKQCRYIPKEIREDIRTDYGVELSYNACRRARESAIKQIRGSLEHSNALLPSMDKRVVRRKRAPSGTVPRKRAPSGTVPRKRDSSVTVQRRCHQCGTYGHNRQTCANPTPPQPQSEGKS